MRPFLTEIKAAYAEYRRFYRAIFLCAFAVVAASGGAFAGLIVEMIWRSQQP